MVAYLVMATLGMAEPHAAAPLLVRDLENRAVDPLQSDAAVTATALVFVSVDCPISNRYAPDIRRLIDTFTEKGVRFWLVYPNPAESAGAIRKHLAAYSYPNRALRDPQHQLARVAQITVTPEAAVFTRAGALAYHGRIDDRIVELGRERPTPTTHDLAQALATVLSGKPVSPASTQAFGCFVADFK